ncbi:hypothetical protein [Floccifex sp.]|uniref:hypothetical protein n=1 Tax=Floccifex sp. TaxID=2815810 RepID=UPI003F11E550
MKKTMKWVLSAFLVLGMAACSSGGGDTSDGNDTQTNTKNDVETISAELQKFTITIPQPDSFLDLGDGTYDSSVYSVFVDITYELDDEDGNIQDYYYVAIREVYEDTLEDCWAKYNLTQDNFTETTVNGYTAYDYASETFDNGITQGKLYIRYSDGENGPRELEFQYSYTDYDTFMSMVSEVLNNATFTPIE